MTTFTPTRSGWNKAKTIAWFGERGRPLKPSQIKRHQYGTISSKYLDASPQHGTAAVIRGETNDGAIDLSCLSSNCYELFDSIPLPK